jgi:hypothetical protein
MKSLNYGSVSWQSKLIKNPAGSRSYLALLGLLKNYVVKHGENHFRSILKIVQKFFLWIRIINWILIRNTELWIRRGSGS